jgi:hypothetical protein
MDTQNSIVEMLGRKREKYVEKIKKTASGTYTTQILVLYIRVAFRKGFPEMNRRNKIFARIASGNSEISMIEESEVMQAMISPEDENIVISKNARVFSTFERQQIKIMRSRLSLIAVWTETKRCIMYS